MKSFIRVFLDSVVIFLTLFLYLVLFLIFFLVFSVENWQILTLSRTAGVTMLTFGVVGLLMTRAYGSFDIGKRKSKPIIHSIVLAILVTDIVTYAQLVIMNVNEAQGYQLNIFSEVGTLFFVFLAQVVFIYIMTYFGNYMYFKVKSPDKTCIISSSAEAAAEALKNVKKYKKQYKVKKIINYVDPAIYDVILNSESVFLCDVPIKERERILEFCYNQGKNVFFTPEINDVIEVNAIQALLDDHSFVNANIKGLSLQQRISKRTLDLFVCIPAIIFSSPIWLISAIMIKCCDGGKIFFTQNRATRGGRIFKVYKFRTMKENCENRSAITDDERITAVGKLLRKTRLDELPQFINVLLGDMSLIGPRPEMIKNVLDYTKELPEFKYRLLVKAGLSGYAQIVGKYNTSPKNKLILDLTYIKKYNIWIDLKLILQTLIVFFKSDSTEAFSIKDDELLEQLKTNFENKE